ncbi:MAG: hypothetical protein JHC31_10580 [Sulfurihydrogenibium sp.]|nr:hypothetical protein [Sulfurihydrogenibium sp.]
MHSLGWGICIPPFQTLPTPTGGILEVPISHCYPILYNYNTFQAEG